MSREKRTYRRNWGVARDVPRKIDKYQITEVKKSVFQEVQTRDQSIL